MLADKRPVLAAYDFSHDGEAAVEYAAELADRLGCELQVVHVVHLLEPTGPTIMSGTMIRSTLRRACNALRELAERVATAHPHVRIRTAAVVGEPADVLVHRSAAARLTVAGARGLGGHPALRWGSTSKRLASRGHGPVVLVRSSEFAGRPASRGPIIVLADTGAHGASATDFAASIDPDHSRYVITIYETAIAAHMALNAGGLPLSRMIIRVWNNGPDAVATVCHLADDYGAELVVVGREHRRWPFRFEPGSAVDRLADSLGCPLAIVEATSQPHPTEYRQTDPKVLVSHGTADVEA